MDVSGFHSRAVASVVVPQTRGPGLGLSNLRSTLRGAILEHFISERIPGLALVGFAPTRYFGWSYFHILREDVVLSVVGLSRSRWLFLVAFFHSWCPCVHNRLWLLRTVRPTLSWVKFDDVI